MTRKENYESFQKFVSTYWSALNNKNIYNDDTSPNGFYEFMKYFKGFMYTSVYTDLADDSHDEQTEKQIRTYCDYIANNITPVLRRKINSYRKEINSLKSNFDSKSMLRKKKCLGIVQKWMELEDDFAAIAASRDITRFALYIERGNLTKLWNKTIHLFKGFFYYVEQVIFRLDKIKMIRISCFPGAGKTYAMNLVSAFWLGYDYDESILRISYSDQLCKIFVSQIAGIIDTKQYRKVFPKFNIGQPDKVGNKVMYDKYSTETGFKFSFSRNHNFYSATRDGQITGKRAKILMTDDLLKGVSEAKDKNLQSQLVKKLDSEWTTRADSDYQPQIHAGTMWSRYDLLNVVEKRSEKRLAKQGLKLTLDPNYKYIRLAKNFDGSIDSVFISVPILDYDTDESTCPLRYSTQGMKDKREDMDKDLWDAEYQQNPTSSSPNSMSWDTILQYDDNTFPQQIRDGKFQAIAFIDPTRSGNDFFAMPICKRYRKDNGKWSLWYLVDCVYQQRTYEDTSFAEIVLDKLIRHRVRLLGYENNTDNSLGTNIKNGLYAKGYTNIEVSPFFSYGTSKELKIRTEMTNMRANIVYPAQYLYPATSEMGEFMEITTTYDPTNPKGVAHDDAIDSLAMLSLRFMHEETTYNTTLSNIKIF